MLGGDTTPEQWHTTLRVVAERKEEKKRRKEGRKEGRKEKNQEGRKTKKNTVSRRLLIHHSFPLPLSSLSFTHTLSPPSFSLSLARVCVKEREERGRGNE